MYDLLFSPIRIGGLELRNRIVFAPTTISLAPDERAERILGVARGGAALVVLGDIGVEEVFHKDASDLSSEEGRAECRELVARIHDTGAKVCAQIFAPDYDTAGFVARMKDPSVTREELRDFMYGRVDRYVTEMSLERVEEIAGLFGRRAVQAREAGFDMVQVHGDRLVGSMSSANYNGRDDRFGAEGPQGLASFGCAVVAAIKEQAGRDYPVEYKLAVRQPARGLGLTGPSVAELDAFVPAIVAAGADSFHVTGANHSQLEDIVPPARHAELGGEGCFLNLARAVSDRTDVPVCGVGKLQTPEFIEAELQQGTIQLAAMSRQFLADPNWAAKAAEGRANEIRRCVYCNRRCIGALRTHAPFGCVFDASR